MAGRIGRVDRGPTSGQPSPPIGIFKGQTGSPGCLEPPATRLCKAIEGGALARRLGPVREDRRVAQRRVFQAPGRQFTHRQEVEDRLPSATTGLSGARPRHSRGSVEEMAASTRDSLLDYLGVLDRRLVDTGTSTPLYLSGGAAVVLAYGSTERTKDVDAFVAERNQVLDEL